MPSQRLSWFQFRGAGEPRCGEDKVQKQAHTRLRAASQRPTVHVTNLSGWKSGGIYSAHESSGSRGMHLRRCGFTASSA